MFTRSSTLPFLFTTCLLSLAILHFPNPAAAASPISFCKCTCFANSTIIPLDDQPPSAHREKLSSSSSSSSLSTSKTEGSSRSCSDCNRQFCLSYNLPICKGAEEEDVFTTCFQRDSRKDEAIVFIFIAATVGLLVWASIRGWVGRWIEAARERSSYVPVSGQGEG